ncbi:glycoside hydrolase family 5 protein [Armillaria novae-zelandiae]|uniref:Glycoside hydrolase family 5 protein n=1 Tax=Armillaria novae-zelandiae TaxID=153914 RepID=A0AA39UR75_9AGAR|nr:glycoside hydrolase family 5 protein [Armillaria novae-zelandiae]
MYYYLFYASFIVLFSLSIPVQAVLPNKVYGVNLGSWLVLESWMLPQGWLDMGGQQCSDCSKCIATEFAFARAYPDTVDEVFNKHWSSWFNQTDVNALVEAGINTVRIPLGYWIVEALVNRTTEFYPRGGISHLKRGLKELKNCWYRVQTPGQMFTGRCTSDVEFYVSYLLFQRDVIRNSVISIRLITTYHRALVWTAVMTTLSHLDPDFSNVIAIEAVNEPIMNATQTPGYGDFQKNFVQVVRAVEQTLGVSGPWSWPNWPTMTGTDASDVILAMENTTSSSSNPKVQLALKDAMPIITDIGMELGWSDMKRMFASLYNREPLYTRRRFSFMDINWQNSNPANPSAAQSGPQVYDNHLYYSFGGVADANEQAYMTSICNLQRVQADADLGNSPLVFGEWALTTQFTASDAFLIKWADAQKLAYTKGAGWIFWNFKVENSTLSGDLGRQWSYLEGVQRGYFSRDPSKLHDTHVCDAYIQ